MGSFYMDIKRKEKLQAIQAWMANKPRNDAQWAEDVKAESLDIRPEYQLAEMEEVHERKLSKVGKDLDKFTNWPEVVRYELTQQFQQMFDEQDNPEQVEGKTLQEWVDEEFEDQKTMYEWKAAKLEQSAERIRKERELRKNKKVTRKELR